jgi:hypothetical protein
MRPVLTWALAAGLMAAGQITADAAQCRGLSFDPACRAETRPGPTVSFRPGQNEIPQPSAPATQTPTHRPEHGLVARAERPAIDCKMPIVASDGSVDLTMRVVKPNADAYFSTPVIAVPRCATETPRTLTPHAPVRK